MAGGRVKLKVRLMMERLISSESRMRSLGTYNRASAQDLFAMLLKIASILAGRSLSVVLATSAMYSLFFFHEGGLVAVEY